MEKYTDYHALQKGNDKFFLPHNGVQSLWITKNNYKYLCTASGCVIFNNITFDCPVVVRMVDLLPNQRALQGVTFQSCHNVVLYIIGGEVNKITITDCQVSSIEISQQNTCVSELDIDNNNKADFPIGLLFIKYAKLNMVRIRNVSRIDKILIEDTIILFNDYFQKASNHKYCISIYNCLVYDLDLQRSTIEAGILLEKFIKSEAAILNITINESTVRGLFTINDINNIDTFKICRSLISAEANIINQHSLSIHDSVVKSLKVNSTSIKGGLLLYRVFVTNLVINDSATDEMCRICNIDILECSRMNKIHINLLEIQTVHFFGSTDIDSIALVNISFLPITDRISTDALNKNLSTVVRQRYQEAVGPNCSFEFNESACRELYLSNISNGHAIRFVQSSVIAGTIRAGVQENISSRTSFKEIIFNKMLFYGSTLLFDTVNCNKIIFENFTNSGLLYLKKISKIEGHDNILKIQNSDLGKTHFINCELETGWKHDFSHSKILDIHVIASKFPQDSINNSDEVSLFQNRLLYSQLYKIYESSGSRLRAILYQKLGLESYYLHLRYYKLKRSGIIALKWKKKILQLSDNYPLLDTPLTTLVFFLEARISYLENAKKKVMSNQNMNAQKKRWKETWDYFALFLHRWSSDFDYKLNRALVRFFFVSIFLFFMYVSFLQKGLLSKENLFNTVSHFFIFINPAHNYEFIKNQENAFIALTSSARLIDGISRIIVSYLIYQLVQSFRKFGKK